MNKLKNLRSSVFFVETLLSLGFVCSLNSCIDGYESPNGFDIGVSHQQLTTPDSLSFTVNDDGTLATISWPRVKGCSGYEVTMMNIDNPDSTYFVERSSQHVVFDHYVVDGCTMTCDIQLDSKYSFQIKVIGETKYSNKDGLAVDTMLSTLVPSLCTIPDGSDIYEYFQTNSIDSLASVYAAENRLDTVVEVAIDLEKGGHYTMSGPVDCRGYNMTVRGSKLGAAFVDMSDKAAFLTYGGIKLKYLRLDMTNSTANALIAMSADSLPESIKSQYFGCARNGSLISNIYIVENSIFCSDVWVKNLPNSFVGNNGIDCAWWDLTISNCIVQCKNSGSRSFVGFDYAGNKISGGRMIKNITIKNSTIFNVLDNSSAYFLRYGNQSNANVEKTFGNATGTMKICSISMLNVTFSKIYSGQKWFNNINGTGLTGLLSHCIFYDLYQPFRRSMEKGGAWTCRMNFFYRPSDLSDTDYTRTDTYKNTCAVCEDPQFEGDVTQELDLTAKNGGVNFRPGLYDVRTNQGGDTRWLN